MALWRWVSTRFLRDRKSKKMPERRLVDEALTHVIILDGTMSRLEPGYQSHARMAYDLLKAANSKGVFLHYQRGLQFKDRSYASAMAVLAGRGIDLQIQQAYGALASRYRPGDKIFLLGYSRGAYAVRSLGGIIDRVGLLTREHATQRNVNMAYRLYRNGSVSEIAQCFIREKCHHSTQITAIGVWDTVKALGIRVPLIWRIFAGRHKFHNDQIGSSVCNGFQALALDEMRTAFKPVMWSAPPNWAGSLEQKWFRGNHSDIGGQTFGASISRPLSNIPFVWVMQQLQSRGLLLAEGWDFEISQDVNAPSTGNWRGLQKFFLARSRREVGRYPSERIHSSVPKNGLGRLAYLHDNTSG